MRLIERVWFEKHSARYVLVPLLLPLSCVFFVLSKLRKLAFKLGIKSSYQANMPVIIVGNIGVGGNGKTPLVLWLVELLIAQGYKPGVIARGYGGKAPHYPYLINSDSPVEYCGDEPYLIYHRTKVAVCVSPNRQQSIELLEEQGCNIIIADDGMQHYKLNRDVEIAVIDGKRRLGNGFLLPAGPLREGPNRLKQTDYVICNSGAAQQGEITMSLTPGCFINIGSDVKLSPSDFMAAYPRVNAIAGIGAPQRFFDTLTSLGINISHTQGFVDHHQYQASDFEQLPDAHLPVVMTEKDAVKCQHFNLSQAWYLTVDARLPEHFEHALLNKIADVAIRKQ